MCAFVKLFEQKYRVETIPYSLNWDLSVIFFWIWIMSLIGFQVILG